MSNITTDMTPQQTKDDIHQLMQSIVRNLSVAGQPMSCSGLIRVESALANVLSRRDEQTTRLQAAIAALRDEDLD